MDSNRALRRSQRHEPPAGRFCAAFSFAQIRRVHAGNYDEPAGEPVSARLCRQRIRAKRLEGRRARIALGRRGAVLLAAPGRLLRPDAARRAERAAGRRGRGDRHSDSPSQRAARCDLRAVRIDFAERVFSRFRRYRRYSAAESVAARSIELYAATRRSAPISPTKATTTALFTRIFWRSRTSCAHALRSCSANIRIPKTRTWTMRRRRAACWNG